MKQNEPHYLIPNYVIQALIAGILFLLAATILGLLIFTGTDTNDTDDIPVEETVEKETLDERLIVVLDAGHGGADPGAVPDKTDITEAEITQIIIDKLYDLLNLHINELRVELAHQPGTDATPLERANVALGLQADFFLSLHLNADTSTATRGFQVYPTPPGRVHHAESLRFAELLVEQIEQTNAVILGDNGIFYAYYHETATGYWQEQVDSVWVDYDNPSDSASFGVLENAGCPAVLVEQWFISNAQDMAAFNNEKGYDTMARCLYLALCDYFGLLPMA